MTMKEKLEMHRQIEQENWEKLQDFICMMSYEALSVDEIAQMISEKDRAMEWDDQFHFLCELLDRKTEVVTA